MKKLVFTIGMMSITSSLTALILDIVSMNISINRFLFNFLNSFLLSFGAVLAVINLTVIVRNPEVLGMGKVDKHD